MKKILIISILGLLMASCVDLDVPPKNNVYDEELMSNEAGMKLYLSRMYSLMPFEDFKYMGQWGFKGSSWLGAFGIDGTGEALNRDGICRSFTGEDETYWNDTDFVTTKPFFLLRDANYLIATLPKYKSNFAEVVYENYLGQAYFVRAFVFYTMAKRFGGVPLVTSLIPYPAESDVMEVPRASEEATWDQIMLDFKTAADMLMPTSHVSGTANKYVALSYLAEAMNYAGSVAKYNQTIIGNLTGLGEKTGVRVIGFAENSWEDAAKRYFTAAYDAAREVMRDGGYSLYKAKWSASDRNAQYQNMVDMFSDLSSKENIFVAEYMAPSKLHGIDAYSGPYKFRGPLSAGTCPTLDFVELFDGFDRNADGTLKVLGSDGKYLMFDTPMDFFANAEPRLRAYVLLPGDMFKGTEIEVRAGTYTGSDFSPLLGTPDKYDYANSASSNYQDLNIAKGASRTLWLSSNSTTAGNVIVPGTSMYASGENGPYYENAEATITGFYLRKWLNPDPNFVPGEGKSNQPFILMRYADVLLAAAEAGVELSLLGAPSPDGSDMLQVATDAIAQIRERAGADALAGPLTSSVDSRDIVRKERRKELAFEHKTKWDLRRWRVIDVDNRAGFWGEANPGWASRNSSNTNYRFRGLYPFYSTETGKYFFDARFQWISLKTFGYSTLDYYFSIPSGEVNKSPVIDQQPNR